MKVFIMEVLKDVKQWAIKNDLINPNNMINQIDKIIEEVNELNYHMEFNMWELYIDDIGDIVIASYNLYSLCGYEEPLYAYFTDCANGVLDDISIMGFINFLHKLRNKGKRNIKPIRQDFHIIFATIERFREMLCNFYKINFSINDAVVHAYQTIKNRQYKNRLRIYKEANIMVYIAAPFFNEQQIKRVEKVKELLKELGFKYFSPKDESNLLFKNDYQSSISTFELNIEKIKECAFMVCITNDRDTGTLFEAGLAYGLNKHIFYLYDEGHNFNLMLANSGVASTSILELKQAIIDVGRNNMPYKELLQRRSQNAKLF